jgi:hypothetical protein
MNILGLTNKIHTGYFCFTLDGVADLKVEFTEALVAKIIWVHPMISKVSYKFTEQAEIQNIHIPQTNSKNR